MRGIVSDIIRYLLLALFVYTAASKMLTYPQFVVQLGLSPLLPNFFPSIGWAVPMVELMVAICLAVPALQTLGLVASWVLMLVFTLYVGAILTVASHIPCSCGGVIAELSWQQHLVFNLVFLALNTLVLVWHYRARLHPMSS